MHGTWRMAGLVFFGLGTFYASIYFMDDTTPTWPVPLSMFSQAVKHQLKPLTEAAQLYSSLRCLRLLLLLGALLL